LTNFSIKQLMGLSGEVSQKPVLDGPG